MRWWAIFLLGALGGILPTIARLATVYANAPDTPAPAIGVLYAALGFAIIGGVIALTTQTADIRSAIFAGISAPAIISGVASGIDQARPSPATPAEAHEYANSPKTPTTFGDFWWALGGQRAYQSAPRPSQQ
jgi:hypothetical protein